jgi:hypothetical protein
MNHTEKTEQNFQLNDINLHTNTADDESQFQLVAKKKKPSSETSTNSEHQKFTDKSQDDFKRKPHSDVKGKFQRDFREKPQGDFKGKPNGDFKTRPQGDFKEKPQGDFKTRPQGDFKGNPNGNFKGNFNGNFKSENFEKNLKSEGEFSERPPKQFNYNRSIDMFCNFCANQNVSEEECKGHTPRTCPRLKEYECPACKEKGHTRNRCTALYCKFCRNIGHEVENCPKIVGHTCTRCKQVGHFERQCTVYCSYCRGAVGHRIEECPYKECKFCGDVGHLAGPDCPMRQYSYQHKNT